MTRCLLGIVVLPAWEGGPRACHVNSHTQELQNPSISARKALALTAAFSDWPDRLPIFSLPSTISCAEAQPILLFQAQLKSSLMALIFPGKLLDPAEGEGLSAEGSPVLQAGDKKTGGRRRHFGLGGGSGGTRCAVRAPHGGWSGSGERPGQVGCLQ